LGGGERKRNAGRFSSLRGEKKKRGIKGGTFPFREGTRSKGKERLFVIVKEKEEK